MKKLLAVAAIAALVATPALAQRDRDSRGGDQPQSAPAAAPAAPSNRGAAFRGEAGRQAGSNSNSNQANPNSGQSRSRFNNGQNNAQSDQRTGNNQPGSRFNRNFTAPHRYRGPVYHRPAGFYVHRWSFGEFLPSAFWAQDYWLSDYFDFGLVPPPPGTRWVRYGGDALLIDRFSGEVIQVAYNVFY